MRHLNWRKVYRYRETWAVRLAFLLILLCGLVWTLAFGVSKGKEENFAFADMIDLTLDAFEQTALAQTLDFSHDSGLDYEARCRPNDPGLCPRVDILFVSELRWPRVVMAALIGAGLGITGAALQGIFRNPLAEPGLIGVSGGAAIGAAIAIWQDFDASAVLRILPHFSDINVDPMELSGPEFGQALAAFVAGIVVTALVYRMARWKHRTDVTSLLLIGLAVNAIAAAFIGMIIAIVGRSKVGDINDWTLGGVSQSTWLDIWLLLPFVTISLLVLPFFARQLNLMALGEADARHLGVSTERLRVFIISLSALTVGVSVALAGILAFVGLFVPHVIRLLVGPDHRILLPASIFGGAIFLVWADYWGRTIPDLGEIPLGSMTTLIGGPLFLLLIVMYRARGAR
jgi:iron complex transport system permease protein